MNTKLSGSTGEDTPVAVKLDVEGLENDILERFLQQGAQAPPVLFVDFDSICCCLGSPAYCSRKKAEGEAMVGRLQAAGYELFRRQGGGGDYTFWRRPAAQPVALPAVQPALRAGSGRNKDLYRKIR